MTTLDEKMNTAVSNDNFTEIENIALNPDNALVRVSSFNMFTNQIEFKKTWVNISNVGRDFFEDLSGDCQDYISDLVKYKNMDYDSMVESYDNEVEKTDPYNLKDFGLSYSK